MDSLIHTKRVKKQSKSGRINQKLFGAMMHLVFYLPYFDISYEIIKLALFKQLKQRVKVGYHKQTFEEIVPTYLKKAIEAVKITGSFFVHKSLNKLSFISETGKDAVEKMESEYLDQTEWNLEGLKGPLPKLNKNGYVNILGFAYFTGHKNQDSPTSSNILSESGISLRFGGFYLQIKLSNGDVLLIKKVTEHRVFSNVMIIECHVVDPSNGTVKSVPGSRYLLLKPTPEMQERIHRFHAVSNGLNTLLKSEIQRKLNLSLEYSKRLTTEDFGDARSDTDLSKLVKFDTDPRSLNFPHQCHELSMYTNSCSIGYMGQFVTESEMTILCNNTEGISTKEKNRQISGIPIHRTSENLVWIL